MPTDCDIIFDNHERVFYGGQLLSGSVRLTLTKEKEVRGVYVKIFGRAYAYWTEYCSRDLNHHHHHHGHNDNNHRSSGHHVSFSSEELYLNEKTYFVGSENGNVRLPAGTHSYTFQCMLPIGLPTSVEHGIGHINYGVRVVMDIPMWPDKEFLQNFTVIKPINLNVDPSFRSPSRDSEEKVFYPMGIFCCCPSGPLKIQASAPVRGYTPGQTINVTIDVQNESDEKIDEFDVELVKELTFYGTAMHDGRYERSQKIVYDRITSVGTAGCDVLKNVRHHANLRVPSIPPTDTSTSNVVHSKYLIHVRGVADGCCTSDLKLNLPVTIGTIPIQDFGEASNGNPYPETVVTNQPSSPMLRKMPNAPSMPSAPSMPNAPNEPMKMPPLPNGNSALPYPSAPMGLPQPSAPTAPDLPADNPPTYEEALNPGENSNNFKPKYPMFRRQTSYSIDMK